MNVKVYSLHGLKNPNQAPLSAHIVPNTQEAKAGGLLETKNSSPVWASLQNLKKKKQFHSK